MSFYQKSNFRSILLFLVITAILWFVFAPVQIGGSVGYVIIDGNSMEPEISVGDLVIARRGADYGINQRVVYKHPQVGFVFHRIIDQADDTFILKGDNNDWVDSYQPTTDDIIGSFWFKVPTGGLVIRKLREPIIFTGFTLIILIIIASLIIFQKPIRSKKSKLKSISMENQSSPSSRGARQEILLVLGIIAISALVLAVVAYTRPVTQEISTDLTYQHQGEFDYTSQETIYLYDTATVKTGDPIYFVLACDVIMDFDYSFSSRYMSAAERSSLIGSYQISAVLSDIDGWKRTFKLVPETEFSGNEFNSQTDLNVCDIQSLILNKEETTGVENRIYELSLNPIVNISGTLEGMTLQDSYAPNIVFQINSDLMRLPDQEENLALDQEGFLTKKLEITNFLNIFGQQFDVVLARQISVISLGVCLLAALYPSWTLYKDWKKSEISRIQVQYHPLLVDVRMGSPMLRGAPIVAVTSFQDLVKMAEKYGAMILHESKGSFHRYSVLDDQYLYQYSIDVHTGDTLFPEIVIFQQMLRNGISEGELELYYQPVVLLKDNSIIGFEAFIRWNHPEYGILYPADFITQAEESGLIPEIDRWVTRTACQQLRLWNELGLPQIPVSINISPETIVDRQFIEDVRSIVLENVCQPEYLQFEINRSNQVFVREDIKDHLGQLNQLGIRLAIDNFATNAANQINQVSQMPIQIVKIDRAVMQDIHLDQANQRLISAVVKMAKSLQVEVIAQGVESQEQIAFLEEQDIQLAQGYFLSDPLQANEIPQLLEQTLPDDSWRS